jgi:hypothetical protein
MQLVASGRISGVQRYTWPGTDGRKGPLIGIWKKSWRGCRLQGLGFVGM